LTNKQSEINHINENHIKFEVSLHFWGIWPSVRLKVAAYILAASPEKLRKKSRQPGFLDNS
jgi:hypothetical protein